MENNFHGLPPLKRFRLMQQQEASSKTHNPNNPNSSSSSSSCLPAKKRKENRDPSPLLSNNITNTTYSLPAKKRIWAPPPPPLSPIDLNVEYSPSFDDKEPSQSIDIPKPFSNKIQKLDTIFEDSFDPFEDDEVVRAGEDPSASIKDEGVICAGEDPSDSVKDDGVIIAGEDPSVSIEDDGVVCAICLSTDGDPLDPIVFCDGCDLMVHTTCYGHPLTKGVPEGDWFCTQCLISKPTHNKKSLSCCLCPIPGGALKPTINGKWAHIVCALFVPEVFFSDPEGREGIDFSKVPQRRWEKSCYVCKIGKGCVIDCSEPKCPLSFHVTCGFQEDLSIEYKEEKNKGAIVAGFCKRHTDLWKKQQSSGKYKIVAREE